MWWFNTEQDRDKYFTIDGLTELGNAAMAKVQQLDNERDNLATEADSFTDWLLQ